MLNLNLVTFVTAVYFLQWYDLGVIMRLCDRRSKTYVVKIKPGVAGGVLRDSRPIITPPTMLPMFFKFITPKNFLHSYLLHFVFRVNFYQ